ncbi:MAG: sugar phosphate nucleotidyltransferase [Clostridiales bacterium]|nr:sugar phosphate nucleotidyltransferase [Clostridiales bacterium]
MDKPLDAYIVAESLPIIEAMSVINENGKGVAFVCEELVLKGVVTDGNIRRYILKNGDLSAPVCSVSNTEPKYLDHHEYTDPKRFMCEHGIKAVPIINSRHEIIAINFLYENQVYKSTSLNVPVVIMAGGKGTRLAPYTNVLPKPLIPVGDKTIIEIIMDKFAFFGCRNFDIIINYKGGLIKAFFEDMEDCGYSVEFIDEEVFNGTGGSLSLLRGKYNETFFMNNCDIVVEEDYSEILRHHKQRGNIVTMVTALVNVQIDYGTVTVSEKGLVTALKEKPTVSELVNTGLYVIEPRFLDYVPDNTFIHITDAIEAAIAAGERVGAYPVSEAAWFDMGELTELKKMREKFEARR